MVILSTYQHDLFTYPCHLSTIYQCNLSNYRCDLSTYQHDLFAYPCHLSTIYRCNLSTYQCGLSIDQCDLSHHHHHLSLNCKGHWGTTDDFTTSFLHFSLFSTAIWDLPNSRPVHSLMLSSHLFFCLPCLLPPRTVPCKMVLARPGEWETRPYHCSLRLFTIVRSSSCGPIFCWIFHGLPRWKYGLCTRCVVSCGSTSFP